MKKRYDLPNRDGLKIWLEQDSENSDKFILKGNYYSMRYSIDNNNQNSTCIECGFIDPNGGPFISLGYKLDEHTEVAKIEINGSDIIVKIK